MAYDVPSGPWAPTHGIGGWGGDKFLAFKGNDGVLVKTLSVTYNSKHLRGLRLTYNDNTRSQQIGGSNDTSGSITFAPGEVITQASLWGNGIGTRTGRIRFTTDKGQTFDVGKNTAGQTEYSIDVGSGFLAGFSGRAHDDIDMLAFLFLGPVRKVEIKDVRYQIPQASQGIGGVALDQAVFTNNSREEEDWTFSNSVTRKNSVSWGSTSSIEFGMHATVTAGIPEVASAEIGYEWTVGSSRSWDQSEEWEVSLSWGHSGHLAPGKSVTVTATCQYGNANIDYTCQVVITTSRGTLRYNDSGVLKTAQYAFAESTVRDGKHSEMAHVPKDRLRQAEKQGRLINEVEPPSGPTASDSDHGENRHKH